MFKVLGKIDESVDLAAEDEKVLKLAEKYRDEVEKSLDWFGKRELSDEEFDEMYDWIADNAKDGDVDVQELKKHMQNYVLQHDDDGEDDGEEDEADFEHRRDVHYEQIGDLVRDEEDYEDDIDESDDGEKEEEDTDDGDNSSEKALKAVRKALKDALKKVNKALGAEKGKKKDRTDKKGEENTDGEKNDVGSKGGEKKGKDGKGDDVDIETELEKGFVDDKKDSLDGGTDKKEPNKNAFGADVVSEGERPIKDVYAELTDKHKKAIKLVAKFQDCADEDCKNKILRKMSTNALKINRLNDKLKRSLSDEK